MVSHIINIYLSWIFKTQTEIRYDMKYDNKNNVYNNVYINDYITDISVYINTHGFKIKKVIDNVLYLILDYNKINKITYLRLDNVLKYYKCSLQYICNKLPDNRYIKGITYVYDKNILFYYNYKYNCKIRYKFKSDKLIFNKPHNVNKIKVVKYNILTNIKLIKYIKYFYNNNIYIQYVYIDVNAYYYSYKYYNSYKFIFNYKNYICISL